MPQEIYLSQHTGQEIDDAVDKVNSLKLPYLTYYTIGFYQNNKYYDMTLKGMNFNDNADIARATFDNVWLYLKNSFIFSPTLHCGNSFNISTASNAILILDLYITNTYITVKGRDVVEGNFISYTLYKDNVISTDPEAPEGYKEILATPYK